MTPCAVEELISTCGNSVMALTSAAGQMCGDRVVVLDRAMGVENEAVLVPAGLVHAVGAGVDARDWRIADDREAALAPRLPSAA